MSNTAILQRYDLAMPSLFGAEPRFFATGIFLALSLLATLFAMTLDTSMFLGDSVWIKPVKFQIALSVYMLTLAFFARFLPQGMTARTSYKLFSFIVVLAIVAETLWVSGAAIFGIASHFNTTPGFMSAIYPVMGLLAITLTSASLVYGIAIWRNRESELKRSLRHSLALGLVLTFVLTVPVAGTLSSMGGHYVGVPVTGAVLPLFGWSGEVGDLRVSHFLATHAMHFVPLAGLAISRLFSGTTAVRIVWASAVIFCLVVVATFVQALAGLPLLMMNQPR